VGWRIQSFRINDLELVDQIFFSWNSEFFAVLSLIDASFRKPELAWIWKIDEDGQERPVANFFATAAEVRIKVPAAHLAGITAGKTSAQTLLEAARSSQHLYAALDLLGNGTLTWPRMYRMFGAVARQYCGTLG
jgi:hypothetical protein